MRRFQKVLFTLAVVVTLGWIAASTASAQIAFLASASGARRLRFEGLTEATGTVVLTTTSIGTVTGAAAFPGAGGSQIIFDYGTLVASTGDSAPPDAALLNCSGTVTLSGFTAGVVAKSCAGNAVILTVTTTLNCPGNCTLTLRGVRVNANFRGAGANISVSITAAPIAGDVLTVTTLGALVVGTVQAAPSTTVTALATGGGATTNVPLCTVASLAGAALGTLTLTIVENFPDAFLSGLQEDALGLPAANTSTGPAGFNAHSSMRVRFTGIMKGLKIAAGFGATTSATLTTVLPSVPVFTANDEDSEQDFDMRYTTTSQTAIETLVVTFTFSIPNLANFDATKEATVQTRVWLRGAADVPASAVFSTAAASTQYNATGIRTLVCASYLLFPWVAYVSDGTLDTGIAISNTSADPAVLNSTKQKGDITLYFWTADGSTPPAPLKIATALDAGKSATFVASQIGKAYTGYVIAVCGFQMGHGIAAFLSPKAGVFGASYMALSLFNPRLPGGGTEFVTQ